MLRYHQKVQWRTFSRNQFSLEDYMHWIYQPSVLLLTGFERHFYKHPDFQDKGTLKKSYYYRTRLWNFMKFRCDKKKSINLWQPYILQCSNRLLCEYISLWKPVSTILQQMNLVKSWLRFLLFPMFLSLHWNHVWLLSLFGIYIETP